MLLYSIEVSQLQKCFFLSTSQISQEEPFGSTQYGVRCISLGPWRNRHQERIRCARDSLGVTPVKERGWSRRGYPVKEGGKKNWLKRVLDFSTALRKFSQANGVLRKAPHWRSPTSLKNGLALGSLLDSVICWEQPAGWKRRLSRMQCWIQSTAAGAIGQLCLLKQEIWDVLSYAPPQWATFGQRRTQGSNQRTCLHD